MENGLPRLCPTTRRRKWSAALLTDLNFSVEGMEKVREEENAWPR
jgi:hypothetical protein